MAKDIIILVIFLTLIGLFIPYPYVLPFIFLLLIIMSVITKFLILNITALVLSLIFTVFNWSFIGTNIILYQSDFVEYIVSLRVLAFIYISYFFFSVLKNFKINLYIVILLTLTFFSFVKSSDYIVALKYMINVYFPFFLILIVLLNLTNNHKLSIESLKKYKIYNYVFKIFILIILLVDLCFIILDRTELVDLKRFYMNVASLFRGGGEGNFRTVISGFSIERTPGIFADPIVAAYFLSTSFFYVYFVFRDVFIKILLLIIILFLLLLTFSKAGYIMILLGLVGLFICEKVKKVTYRLILLIFIYVTTLAVAIIRALYGDVSDSSAIHVLGLILPFIKPFSFEYIFGNDLGSGGNMGGWVEQGAESFVGLLMYNLGFAGVMIYLYLIYKIIKSSAKLYKNTIDKFIISSIVPVFWVSFLQENSFNLPYSIPKLLFLLGVIIFCLIEIEKSKYYRIKGLKT